MSKSSKWKALEKIIKRVPAQSVYYASSLGAIVLAGGGQLPSGLEFVAGSVGANILSNLVEEIARGEDVLDTEISEKTQNAILESKIERLLTKQDFLQGYARLVQHLDKQQEASDKILETLKNEFSTVATAAQVDELKQLLQQVLLQSKVNAGLDATIFISYSRRNRDFAVDLYDRLKAEGFTLWRDVHDIEAGADDWWEAIKQGIEECDTLILCMSLPALKSPIVSDEWFYARQLGKRVIPIVVEEIWKHPEVLNSEFTIPNWMSRRNWIDYRAHVPESHKAWNNLTNTLNTPYQPKRFINMVGELPPRFVRRPADIDQSIRSLVDDNNDAVAMTTALRGAGGFGKTTLAKAVARDVRIQGAFDDGILWITLGEELLQKQGDALKNSLIRMIQELIDALTGNRPLIETLEMATTKLKEAIGERYILLIVDDVWDAPHLKPFMINSKNSGMLITTRNSDTVSGTDIIQHSVDKMNSIEAVELLSAGFDSDEVQPLATEFANLARDLREYPLLLALVNTTIANYRDDLGLSLAEALELVREQFEEQGVLGFDDTDSSERTKAVDLTLEVSLRQLSNDEKAQYLSLAIFAEDTNIPLTTLQHFWAQSKIKVLQFCQRLYRKTALLHSFEGLSIRIHDVFRDYMIRQHSPKQLNGLHNKLIDAWSDIDLLSDAYAVKHTVYHYRESNRLDEFYPKLFDYISLRDKLYATDIYALLSDFNNLPTSSNPELEEALRLLNSALSMSAHILSQEDGKRQLGNQLLGRLDIYEDNTIIVSLLDSITPEPNTLSRIPTMMGQTHLPAGQALIRTLVGHTGSVIGAIQLEDGKILSWSTDKTLRLWDARGIHLFVMSLDEKYTPLIVEEISNKNLNLYVESDEQIRTMCEIKYEGSRLNPSSFTEISDDDNYKERYEQSEDLALYPYSEIESVDLGQGYRLEVSSNFLNLHYKENVVSIGQHFDKIRFLLRLQGNRFITGSNDNRLNIWSINLEAQYTISPEEQPNAESVHKGHVFAGWVDGNEIYTFARDGSSAKWRTDGHVSDIRTIVDPKIFLERNNIKPIDKKGNTTTTYLDIYNKRYLLRYDLMETIAGNGWAEVESVYLNDAQTQTSQELVRAGGYRYEGSISAYFIISQAILIEQYPNTKRRPRPRPSLEVIAFLNDTSIKSRSKIQWALELQLNQVVYIRCVEDTILVSDSNKGMNTLFYGDAPFTGCTKIDDETIMIGDAEGRVMFLRYNP